jgi:aryl-alcohol dehydrogenase-like predicted oxidoreductase
MPPSLLNPLTRNISRIGLGTYRLALGVPGHERVVYKALERQKDPRENINLIDTSTNYGNGRSEQLIGKVANPRRCYYFVKLTQSTDNIPQKTPST